jgi:hypothetical protein
MIKNLAEDIYMMKCFGCNATDNLTLVAHRRHEKESINGWIVLCDKCWQGFADEQLVLVKDNQLTEAQDELNAYKDPKVIKKALYGEGGDAVS